MPRDGRLRRVPCLRLRGHTPRTARKPENPRHECRPTFLSMPRQLLLHTRHSDRGIMPTRSWTRMCRSSDRSRHSSRTRIEERITAKSRKPAPRVPGELTTDRIARDEAIAAQSLSRKPQRPSRRVLCEHQIRQITPDRCSQSTRQRPFETVTQYAGRPSLRALYESSQIDRKAFEGAEWLRAAGPPQRPFRDVIAALRAERERQGLSRADLAERTGIDRAAIHKLEIGVNTNPPWPCCRGMPAPSGRGSSGISRQRLRSQPRRFDQLLRKSPGCEAQQARTVPAPPQAEACLGSIHCGVPRHAASSWGVKFTW